jgi:uncharacterized membrane protein
LLSLLLLLQVCFVATYVDSGIIVLSDGSDSAARSGQTPWVDGEQDWPQFGRYGSRNMSAPAHSTTGGPGEGQVSAVTTLATIDEPALNWRHYASEDYGVDSLAVPVGDFSDNINVTGEASERCAGGRLMPVFIHQQDVGGSVHSIMKIVDGDDSRTAWQVDLGATDPVKTAPALVDVNDDGRLEIVVAYDAQGTFTLELWSPSLSCNDAGWNSGGHTSERLWQWSDPALAITTTSPYIWANHKIGTQLLIADLQLDGSPEVVLSLVNEANEQPVIAAIPLVFGGPPDPLWQVTLDNGELPSDAAWVQIDDTNSAVLLTTIDPDDGNMWLWRLNGASGAPQWGGKTLNNLDGNTDAPHIRLPGPVLAQLDNDPLPEVIVTIPSDVDGGGTGDGAEFQGRDIIDGTMLWEFRATNGFADAPPHPVDKDGDGVHDRVCWVTWYRLDADRHGMLGCHDLTEGQSPTKAWSHVLDRGGGNLNDEIAVSPPFSLDLDGQGQPDILVAFGRELWAWEGESGTQAGIGQGWVTELSLPHRAWAAPALADIDGDGALDVLIGDMLVSRARADVRPFVDGRGIQFNPSHPDPGETFTLTAYVENVGTETTDAAVDAVLYWDGVEIHRERIDSLDPVSPTGNGDFASFSIDLSAPLGSHTARIELDPDTNITQARHDNDQQTIPLVIVEPYSVSIAIPADPVRVDPGSSIQTSLVVTSTGRLAGEWTLSVDPTGLPQNWTVNETTPGGSSEVHIGIGQTWNMVLEVSAPEDALGSDAGSLSLTMTLDSDTNISYTSLLPIEANRTRGLSVRGPDGTSVSSGMGLPGGYAEAWLLVENLGNAVETVTDRAWDQTAWGNNLTLHDDSGEVNILTLAPGEQRELLARLPVPSSAGLGENVSTTLTICIGTGDDEVCRSMTLTFNANAIRMSPPNIRSVPASGLQWSADIALPAGVSELEWDLASSGMLQSGWTWSASGALSLVGGTLTATGGAGTTVSGGLTLDLPVDAPPLFHPFSAVEANHSSHDLEFSLGVVQVHRASLQIIDPTTGPVLLNVTEPGWFVLRLENPGNGPDTYNLTGSVKPNANFSGDSGVTFSIPSPTYSIGAAGLRQVPVQVTLPDDTPARQGMLIEFELHSQGDLAVRATAVIEIEARQDHRWNLSLTHAGSTYLGAAELFIEPDGTTDLTLTATNIGNFPDALTITSTLSVTPTGNDSDTAWTATDDVTEELAVNSSAQLTISVDVPRLAWNGTTTALTLQLEAGGISLGQFAVTLEVSHRPAWKVYSTGGDLDVEPGGSNISLVVEQRGNLPSAPFITAAIDGFGWNVSTDESLPVLEPGESAVLILLITPPEGAQSGPAVEMTVRARNGDGSGVGETILPVRIRPILDFQATMPTGDWEQWLVSPDGGHVRISLANTGNAPNPIHVELTGLPPGWQPSEADITLAWGEVRGLPVDLVPAGDWDGSNVSVQIRLTDGAGNVRVLDVTVISSTHAWATSPVMWGVTGDSHVLRFHGAGIQAVADQQLGLLEAHDGGWLLPVADQANGLLTLSTGDGPVSLAYDSHASVRPSRSASCTLASNRTVPMATCQIGNGSADFDWTALLRMSDGTIIEQVNGRTLANQMQSFNISALAWEPPAGVHDIEVLVFDGAGMLVTRAETTIIERESGWNIGLTLEQSDDATEVSVLIHRSNHQVLSDAVCTLTLTQGEWSSSHRVNMTVEIAPKLTLDRPPIDSAEPLVARLACAPPWDIDDDPSDDTASLVLTEPTTVTAFTNDWVIGTGAAVVLLAALWLAGFIQPRPKRKRNRRAQRTKPAAKARTQPAPEKKVKRSQSADYGGEMHLEGDEQEPVEEVDEEAIPEMQEGLIEVDDAPVEEEEVLDEFEKRLRSLRGRRKDRGG